MGVSPRPVSLTPTVGMVYFEPIPETARDLPPEAAPRSGDCPPVAAVRFGLRELFAAAWKIYDAAKAYNDLRPDLRDRGDLVEIRREMSRWMEGCRQLGEMRGFLPMAMLRRSSSRDPWAPQWSSEIVSGAKSSSMGPFMQTAYDYMGSAADGRGGRTHLRMDSLESLMRPVSYLETSEAMKGATALQAAIRATAMVLDSTARAMGYCGPKQLDALSDWVRNERALALHLKGACLSMLASPQWTPTPDVSDMCERILAGRDTASVPQIRPFLRRTNVLGSTGRSSGRSSNDVVISFSGVAYRPGTELVIEMLSVTEALARAYLKMCDGAKSLEASGDRLQAYLVDLGKKATADAEAVDEWIESMKAEMAACVEIAAGRASALG